MFITFPPPPCTFVCFWIKFHKGEIIKTHPIQKVFVFIARDSQKRDRDKNSKKTEMNVMLQNVVKEYLMNDILLMFHFNI